MEINIGDKIAYDKPPNAPVIGLCDSPKFIIQNYWKDEWGGGEVLGEVVVADADWDDASLLVTYESSKHKHVVNYDDFMRALEAGVLEIVKPPHPLESLAMCAE